MAVEDSDKEDSKEEYEEVEEEYEDAKFDYREELMCVIEVIRREKKEKQENTSGTREERRHSRTRTNDHKFEGSNRRR
jgi:hypothetical protein